jgi:hypothetical protein
MAQTATQQTPSTAPLPHPETVYLTVKQLALQQPAFKESSLRWALFNAEYNGLAKSGAVVRVGRKVLIDPARFMAWLRSNPVTSPPGAKPSKPRPVAILERGAA